MGRIMKANCTHVSTNQSIVVGLIKFLYAAKKSNSMSGNQSESDVVYKKFPI